MSRYNNFLAAFQQRLEEFKKSTPRKFKTKVKKRAAYNDAKKLINSKNLLLKGQRFIKLKEQKSKSQPEESIAERVKLRRQ